MEELHLTVLKSQTHLEVYKKRQVTAVTRDLGFRLTPKMVLCLKVQSLTEGLGTFNPKPRVAAKRYQQASEKSCKKENTIEWKKYKSTLRNH